MSTDILKPLVVLDLETTGLSTKTHRILQFGAFKTWRRTDELAVETFEATLEMLIDPQRACDPDAFAVHGIGPEQLVGKPTFGQVADRILDFVSGCDLGGYNVVHFDLPMLQAELERCGKARINLDSVLVLDAYRIFKKQESKERHRRIDATRFYLGGAPIEPHAALADAREALIILRAQAARYKVSSREGLMRLGG